jgi:hypothetical protein
MDFHDGTGHRFGEIADEVRDLVLGTNKYDDSDVYELVTIIAARYSYRQVKPLTIQSLRAKGVFINPWVEEAIDDQLRWLQQQAALNHVELEVYATRAQRPGMPRLWYQQLECKVSCGLPR